MIKIIIKLIGFIFFIFIISNNINIKNHKNGISNISLSALASAIAGTCESEDGDECKCAGLCWADEVSCGCL